MKVVIALGSTALLKRGEPMDAKVLRENIARAAAELALIARGHKVIVTHSSGPQAGLLAVKAEAYAQTQQYPLDVLSAEVEGMIGYLIEQELTSVLNKRSVVTLLTQILVDENDPAFQQPSMPIGPAYSFEEAERLKKAYGWTMFCEGAKWRRVVPSPEPLEVMELAWIRLLLHAGAVVVCAGGGGIPVVASPAGAVRGVGAVLDKDLVASLVARQVNADVLLLLSDVDMVYTGWGGKNPRPIRETMPSELRSYPFTPGSMKPKVEAACRFVEAGGNFAGIGKLEDANSILHALKGTIVRPQGTVSLDFQRRSGLPQA